MRFIKKVMPLSAITVLGFISTLGPNAVVNSQSVYVRGNVIVADAKEQITNGFKDAGGTGNESLTGDARIIINTMLFIVGLMAVVMIIYSGIRYITAHGDKQQVDSAKNTLIYSIVGLVIAILAYAIVNWVMNLF